MNNPLIPLSCRNGLLCAEQTRTNLPSAISLVAGILMALAWTPAVLSAEVCYKDESGRIVNRRRPGFERVPCPEEVLGEDGKVVPGARRPGRQIGDVNDRRTDAGRFAARNPVSPVPRPDPSDYPAMVPLPDRWRIVDTLGYKERWYDPYNRNLLKADKPIHDDWFFSFSGIMDSIYEIREVPTPAGGQSTQDAGQQDIFGGSDQAILATNVALEFVYFKGDTVFRPPDWEFRFTPVINVNHVKIDEILGLEVQPQRGDDRTDHHIGIQALFADKHLRNVSERFDFDSLRVGIQPFSSDFRGFLFSDNQLGIRLFGIRENNVFQYNLAWFRRLEKDINSGLNDVTESIRDDDVFVANLYWQDLLVKGFQSQFSLYYNRNRENGFYFDQNGFIARPASIGQERPRAYDVFYVGYNGDGHFGRVNLTTSLYGAFGEEKESVFTERQSDIAAFFAAAEVSMDFDWIRPRLSFLYGSGDDDPFDGKSNGFDAIQENPQFAGADTSYWIRQPVPLIGGGRVALSSRNGVLNSLRSSKEQGQSNFVNPGIWLLGAGVDVDVTPELRVAANWNYLRFDKTDVLEVARNQSGIDEEIGHDISIVATWRPWMTQNIVIRTSYSRLLPGKGYKSLFPDEDSDYLLFNILLAY